MVNFPSNHDYLNYNLSRIGSGHDTRLNWSYFRKESQTVDQDYGNSGFHSCSIQSHELQWHDFGTIAVSLVAVTGAFILLLLPLLVRLEPLLQEVTPLPMFYLENYKSRRQAILR